jgi:hypothetical protein
MRASRGRVAKPIHHNLLWGVHCALDRFGVSSTP